MISGKDFYLFAAFEDDINQGIQILRFLRFLPNFSKNRIPANLLPDF